jgi:hypothetical protein
VLIYNRATKCVKEAIVRSLCLVLASVAVCAVVPAVAARQDAGPKRIERQAGELLDLAARNQGKSLWVRDRCRYEQRLHFERYKYDKKTGKTGEMISTRDTTVVVQPDEKPDETGQTPVIVRVVADTDDRGQPKGKVDPNAKTGLTSGALLDEVFFPLLPENLEHLRFEEIDSSAPGERWFRFAPKQAGVPADRPLAMGVAQIDAATGEVLTMRIDGLTNLKALDSHLEKILSISVKVDYSQFTGGVRLPSVANGVGVSDVSRFQGSFKFVFEEGKYAPVMKIE